MRLPRTFLIVWLGEMLSTLGTQLTAFTLGVWALRDTDSITWYSLFALAAVGPRLLLAPLAGALVDRFDRRRMLLAGHLGPGACTVLLVALFTMELDRLSLVLPLVALSSLLGAAQFPAFQASTSVLVDKAQLGRANGLLHFGLSISHIVAPISAGLLLDEIGVGGVLTLDAVTFLLAILLLTRITIPAPKDSKLSAAATPERTLEMVTVGWRYLRSRPPLFFFLAFFAILNFCLGMAQMLLTPLVLAFADPASLGWVLGQAGFGMLLGSLLMLVWGGPHRLLPGIVMLATFQGVLLALTPWTTNPYWLGLGVLVTFAMRPLLSACSASVWQRKVDQTVQGRVFALRSAIVQGTLPVAYVLAGPLAENVFEPLISRGLGAQLLGPWLGDDPGRGTAALICILGLVIAATATLARFLPPLWQLDQRLPDADS